jgi:hypothetical protein
MRCRWIGLAVIVFAALSVTGVSLSKNHWWLKTNSPKVFINGEEARDSEVFISTRGDYLLDLVVDDKGIGAYTVLRNEKIVGLTPASEFVKLPWCYFVWTDPIPVSPIGSQAAYLTATIQFDRRSVTFTVPVSEQDPQNAYTVKVVF